MSTPMPGRRPLFRLGLALTALRELGATQLGSYALYRFGLRSGHYRRITDRLAEAGRVETPPRRWLPLPDGGRLAEVLGKRGRVALLAEADEIAAGRVRLFGGEPVPLSLDPPEPRLDWTEYENSARGGLAQRETDIKFTWEPARLGWAFTLGRAYYLSGDERYAAVFWQRLEQFLEANPPYRGMNWVSAQEAGLRLIALCFAWQVFADSIHSHSGRAALLAQSIALHAARIPPTLPYARSQNNNHLLSEAAGLYTAGLALPEHPAAQKWRATGWRWFQRGLRAQIDQDGAYCQHSANYQRLMLQLALWMRLLARTQSQSFPQQSVSKLAAATRWLGMLVDRESGRAPNLGPNDGAYILPLTVCPFEDFRPVLQAAAQAFLNECPFEPGLWDEMALWLGDPDPPPAQAKPVAWVSAQDLGSPLLSPASTPHILHSPAGESWAYLRIARFRGRPGHADQLHLDLWRRGVNLALDAGTYLYNDLPPWDNALADSDVHNTVTLDGEGQMRRAGRFLFLERAQASTAGTKELPDGSQQVSARHDGYHRLGAIHRRTVTALAGGGWRIDDALLTAGPPRSGKGHFACLHWLLPDWDWQVQQAEEPGRFLLLVRSPVGPIRLILVCASQSMEPAAPAQLQIARAGEVIYGGGEAKPTWGWASPTYGVKIPALSLRLTAHSPLPILFESGWEFE